jgi:hypothetical protein
MRLIRLRLPASASGLSAVSQSTVPATTANGEGESAADSSGLVGEGEASGIPTPMIDAVEMPEFLRSGRPGGELTAEQGIASDSGARQMLSSHSPSDPGAIDAAMEDVMPSMEVALSDDLESVLTDSDDAATAAGDELFGSL